MKVTFPVFYHLWAELQGWTVPDFHYAVCDWLGKKGRLALLMMPRGHAKSSILDVYNAWKFYTDPTEQILQQGSTDPDAYKVSRGTERVLETHPLTQEVKKVRGETQRWWVNGSTDVRYGSLSARGITSTVTGHRATEIQNDDVEVPQNIATPDAREKLRYRLSEQVHIMIPGGSKLFVGTPHTHDSLYTDVQNMGADCLILRAFQKEARFEEYQPAYMVDFHPQYVFTGMGSACAVLKEGTDYTYADGVITMMRRHAGIIDFYADALWPDRFTPLIMAERRKECRTVNEWDSQYMLRAKPIHDIRLDPDKINIYDNEIEYVERNNVLVATLGNTKITFSRAYWDVAEGKVGNDASVLSFVLNDDDGNLYWHEAAGLMGGIEEQCAEIRRIVDLYHIPNVTVETNGIGKFAPAFLRKSLAGSGCSVTEFVTSGNKDGRILAALETPLSGGILWAHERVANGPAFPQMRDWIPGVKNQPDDYLDSCSGAILCTPVRIGTGYIKPSGAQWAPSGGTYTLSSSFGV